MSISVRSMRTVMLIVGLSWLTGPSVGFATLELAGFGELAWDRTAQPSQSPVGTLGVSANADPSFPNVLNSFNVGLRIVPTSGATGTIEVHSVSQPAVDSVFTTFSPAPSITFPVPSVPTVNGINQGLVDVTVTAPRNLIDLTFSSPNQDAVGTFEIYAVSTFTNYFKRDEFFDGIKFANVPSGEVLISTVSVVPEPGLGVLWVALAAVFFQRSGASRPVEGRKERKDAMIQRRKGQ